MPAPSPRRTVLIVEDELCIRDILAELFDVEGNQVSTAASLDDAKAALARRPFDLIVTDLRLAQKRDGGLQVMAAAGLLADQATIIALTAYPDDDNRAAAMRLGATYFLEKPVDLSVIASLAAEHGVRTAFPVLPARGELPPA